MLPDSTHFSPHPTPVQADIINLSPGLWQPSPNWSPKKDLCPSRFLPNIPATVILLKQVRYYKLDHSLLFQYPPRASNLRAKVKSPLWLVLSLLIALTLPTMFWPLVHSFLASLASWLWTREAGSWPRLLPQAHAVPASYHSVLISAVVLGSVSGSCLSVGLP